MTLRQAVEAAIRQNPDIALARLDEEKARQAMKRAKVPILPGSDGIIATAEEAQEWAEKVGYPVILKAKAGGGGRGMRIVRNPEELPNMFSAAWGEAANAFVKLRAGADRFTLDELKAFLAGKLGKHEIPAALDFVDELPRTSVGKLSRHELRIQQPSQQASPPKQQLAKGGRS